MEQVMSRRTMVGTVLAAGAAGAAGWLGGTTPVIAAGAAPGADDVSLVIGEEVRQAVREMNQRPGAGARRLGGALRVMAAHGRARGLNESVARQFKELVATQGRDAVIMTEPDWAYLRTQAPAYGIDHFSVSPIDRRARARALDAVVAGKFTEFLDRAAAELDAKAREFDRRGVQGFRQVADPTGACTVMMEVENWASMFTRLICVTGAVVGDVPVCVVITGIYFGIWLGNAIDGCH